MCYPGSMRRLGVVTILVAVAALVLVGCDSNRGIQKQKGAPTPAKGSATIVIRSMKFSADATAPAGGKVTVRNEDDIPHTVTSGENLFDTGDIAPHATVTFTAPARPGRHPYFCALHSSMRGTLEVTGSGGGS